MRGRTVAVGLALAGLATGAGAQEVAMRRDFERDGVGRPPGGFSFERTGGRGRAGRWEVRLDPSEPEGDHVLAQLDADETEDRFPLAVATQPRLKDLRVDVLCRPVGGTVDQSCGVVARYRDAANYYVARANALEDNVRLYRVVGGRRQQLASWSGRVASGVWHALGLEARGDQLTVWWEGKAILEVSDVTFDGPGRAGLWTKADSITHFTEFTVTALR